MPNDAAEVEIFHPVTVDVNLIIARQSLDLLNYAPLRPVPFVQERRDYGNTGFTWQGQESPVGRQYPV